MSSLTVKRVTKLMRAGEPARHLDGGTSTDRVRGLYLCIASKSSAHYELRFQLHGRARWMGLGSARELTLAEARERAKGQRKLLLDGHDPLDARRSTKATIKAASLKQKTFKECAEEYVVAHRDGWRNPKHRDQWDATLRDYVYPIVGSLPVDEIDTRLILRILEQRVEADARGHPAGKLWDSRRETASRVRGRIEKILAYATVRTYRSGDNPARWRGHLAEAMSGSASAKVEHHPALPYDQMAAFMQQLRQRDGSAARALEFLILTCARTGEVTGARWNEVDIAKKIWTVPAGRMKAGKEHRVALAPQAITLLESLHREGDGDDGYVFIGMRSGTGLSNMSMTATLRRLGFDSITVHGFRSTFRDWAAECTAYPSEVIEMALAHKVADKVEAAYKRTDLLNKRFRLAADWARYCLSPMPAVKVGKVVVPMRKPAAVS